MVSALSQGVPSLATGWSQKYQQLFEDYGFSEGLVSVIGSDDELEAKIDLLIREDSSRVLRDKLNEDPQS